MINDIIFLFKVLCLSLCALMCLATLGGVILYMFKDKINDHFGEVIIK